MKLNKPNALLYIPDGLAEEAALKRTTHLSVAAHQDDIELMSYQGIAECFGRADKWFTGVVVTDGAGSPRNGIYESYTDEDMKNIRVIEQKKAAFVGEYAAQFLLGYSSKEVKDGANKEVSLELEEIIKATRPQVIYTHNLADKHDTHLGTAVKLINALRNLPAEYHPQKLYACEVWRDLDWVVDEQKELFDISAYPNIAMSLVGVFDSQISGGKRYDLAAQGRRTAHATYSASHGVDTATAVAYAIDLTPLIKDKSIDLSDYICKYIDSFKTDVVSRINRVTK